VPWYKSLKLKDAQLLDEKPWLAFEAVEWMNNYLKKDMTVFEWGSGKSTVYISKRVKKIISVEHDPGWYEVVSRKIKNNSILNCEYILKEPSVSNSKGSGTQVARNYLSSDKKYAGFNFKNYCKAIELFPDKFFDLVLVDGRARTSCTFHALNKVRNGGCLILDDSERAGYLPAINTLKKNGWIRKDFFGPKPYTPLFGQTSIFINFKQQSKLKNEIKNI